MAPRALLCAAPRPLPCRAAALSAARHQPRPQHRQQPFHSHGHPPPPGPFGPAERAILAAAYAHVPEHGFSARALGLGARDAGYPDISPSVLPDGAFALVRWHLAAQREALAPRAKEFFEDAAAAERKPGVGARVAALTWERLMANKPVIHRWQEALAIMAQPSCVPTSLKELAMLSDEIWFLAGDKAVDPSWYTKRATLSMVYSSSELFMTNDTSPDFADTGRFLRTRLDEVQSVGGALGSVGQWVGFTVNAGVNVLRSKGAPI